MVRKALITIETKPVQTPNEQIWSILKQAGEHPQFGFSLV